MAPSRQIIIENESTVRKRSEVQQKQQGDALPNGVICQLPQVADIDFGQNDDLTLIKGLWENLSAHEKEAFNEEYGWIAHLIYVPIIQPMLTTIMHFWDPAYNCFTFGTYDMCPMIEEYQQLINTRSSSNIYEHNENSTGRKQLSKLLGISTQDLVSWELQGSKDISLEPVMEYVSQTSDSQKKLSAMALLIYGTIIFPKKARIIDERVAVLLGEIKHGVNPVLPILAETLRSLTSCRKNECTRFSGCSRLLMIWGLNHFKHVKALGFKRPAHTSNSQSNNYVAEFASQTWPDTFPTRKGWMEFLYQLSEENIEWLYPKQHNQTIIYACANLVWVPLIGLWGATAYAPNMFRRQVGNVQFVPQTAQLDRASFSYHDTNANEFVNNIIQAWKVVRKVRSGKQSHVTTKEYLNWHFKRGKGFTLPPKEEQENSTQMAHSTASSPCPAEDRKGKRKRIEELDENVQLREENEQLKRLLKRAIDGLTVCKKVKMTTKNALDKFVTENSEQQKKITSLEELIQSYQLETHILRESNKVFYNKNTQLRHQLQDSQDRCNLLYNEWQSMNDKGEMAMQQLKKVAKRAEEIAQQISHLKAQYILTGEIGQDLLHFLEGLYNEMYYCGKFH